MPEWACPIFTTTGKVGIVSWGGNKTGTLEKRDTTSSVIKQHRLGKLLKHDHNVARAVLAMWSLKLFILCVLVTCWVCFLSTMLLPIQTLGVLNLIITIFVCILTPLFTLNFCCFLFKFYFCVFWPTFSKAIIINDAKLTTFSPSI